MQTRAPPNVYNLMATTPAAGGTVNNGRATFDNDQLLWEHVFALRFQATALLKLKLRSTKT